MATACPNLRFPKISLELDCKGSLDWTDDVDSIVRVGEIKSSMYTWNKAVEQLSLRLDVIETAVKVVHPQASSIVKKGFLCLSPILSSVVSLTK